MKKRGFTLIELLVVVAIIGILAAIIMVALSSARNKAKDAKNQSDIRNLMSAVELYINDFSDPPAEGSLVDSLKDEEYIKTDPTSQSGASYEDYYFVNGTSYCLLSPDAMVGKGDHNGDFFYAKDGATGYADANTKYDDCP